MICRGRVLNISFANGQLGRSSYNDYQIRLQQAVSQSHERLATFVRSTREIEEFERSLNTCAYQGWHRAPISRTRDLLRQFGYTGGQGPVISALSPAAIAHQVSLLRTLHDRCHRNVINEALVSLGALGNGNPMGPLNFGINLATQNGNPSGDLLSSNPSEARATRAQVFEAMSQHLELGANVNRILSCSDLVCEYSIRRLPRENTHVRNFERDQGCRERMAVNSSFNPVDQYVQSTESPSRSQRRREMGLPNAESSPSHF